MTLRETGEGNTLGEWGVNALGAEEAADKVVLGWESGGAFHLYKPKTLSCVGSCFLHCSAEVVLTAKRLSLPSSELQMTLRKLCLWRCLGQGLLGNWRGHTGRGEQGGRLRRL